jgi:propanediol dehydratase small subunit
MKPRATKTRNGLWARFDEMTWPLPGDRMREVEHALRYGTPTREELLAAASVMQAYAQMVHDPRTKREHVIRTLREVAP